MSDPVLMTKLYAPPPRSRLVSRPHLIKQLNEALDSTPNVTLLSAPAGFGKTTLVSDWLGQIEADIPVAWFSLDKNDNDPPRFLIYFISALQHIDPNLGQTMKSLLQEAQLPHASFEPALWNEPNWGESVITALINEMVAVPVKFVFIFDDYHLIDAPPVHGILNFLVNHLPPHMHIIIISRTNPPLPLSLLRGRGQLLELRLPDLRFIFEETVAFLREVMRLDVSREDAQVLDTRTEGWVTGLQLAALAMRSPPSGSTPEPVRVRDFVYGFAGTHRYVLDYLTDEVLSQQPAEIRRFLLQTSILDRLSASLCDAVTKRKNSRTILRYLDSSNLFIIPLDNERRWYRYHHLFSSLLRHHQKQEIGLEELAPLHQSACDWYNQNGFIEDALGHALAAGNPDQAVSLVEQHSWTMLKRGEMRVLHRWLRILPVEFIRRRARLSLDYAWMLLARYQFDDVEPYLWTAEQQLSTSAPDTDIIAEINTIRAMLVRLQGDAPRAIELHRQTLASLPQHYLFLPGIINLDLGRAYVLNDDLVAAGESLTKAIALNRAWQNRVWELQAMCMLAVVHVFQGHLRQAAKTYQTALQVATEPSGQGMSTWSAVGMAYAGLAEIEREGNNLGQATEYALKAIELGKLGGMASSSVHGYFALARIKETQLDIAGAFEISQEIEQIIRRTNISPWIAHIAAYQAQLQLKKYQFEGDKVALQAGIQWAQTSKLQTNWRQQEPLVNILNHTHNFEHLALARVFMVQKKFDEAMELLTWLLHQAEIAGRAQSIIEILVLQAVTWWILDDIGRALAVLEKACILAEPENYVRVFVDEGSPVAWLLSRMTSSGAEKVYINRLLAAFPDPVFGKRAVTGFHSKLGTPRRTDLRIQNKQNHLPNPLSRRELEVLNLIAVGYTNYQIAQELILAVGTVRRHTNNIYSKLQVRNRTEAVAHARKLKLL